MRYQYFIIAIAILTGCNQKNSNVYPTSREVTINTDSTRVFAQFLIKPIKVTINNDLRYYWYYTDKINSNVGGYNGNLLNGTYRVLSKENRLMEQGTFANGLKDGIWKYWYSNGNLQRIEIWKKGLIKGVPTEYSYNGEVISLTEASEIEITSPL